MENTMKAGIYTPKTQRLSYRLTAYFLSFVTLMSPVIPSLANILPDQKIQQSVASSPIFNRVSSSAVQYQTPEFIESATIAGASLSTFETSLLAKSKSTLGAPSYVPIAVGDITTIIPTYPKYKHIGTRAVQSRYIRTQIEAILGKSLVDASSKAYLTETAQLNTLYANALTFASDSKNATVRFGQPLGLYQDGSAGAAAPANMIWPELRTIHGEKVLVPIVYLTAKTVTDQKVDADENQFGGQVAATAFKVKNTQVRFLRDALLSVKGDTTIASGGSLVSDEALKIVSGGTLSNFGSVKANNGNLVLGAASIHNGTVLYRYDTGQAQGTRYGTVAKMEASGAVSLRSYSDIVFEGGAAKGKNLILAADGNIKLGNLSLFESGESRYGKGEKKWSATTYLQSKLTAEDTIGLAASGAIEINAAEIVAGGHIEILAGLGITVLDELEQYQMQAQGKFRGNRTVNESAYQTVAIRSLLDAGKGVRLSSELGDITLRATDITSSSGTTVSASNGSINMLMTVENDQYNYSSVKESLLTIKTVDRGHTIQNAVPNSIVGGLKVEALYGVKVEYEGDGDLSFDAQLEKFSNTESLSWIADLQHDSSVNIDWNLVETTFNEWDESKTSLSPAAMAVIAIAVTIATSGLAGSVASTLASSSATAQAAIAAGFSSMVSTAATAAANVAVDGGSLGDITKAAFDAVASDDGIKSIATSMITAGIIAKVDAQFFTADPEAVQTAMDTANVEAIADGVGKAQRLQHIAEAKQAAEALSLLDQSIQALTHATVSAGVGTAVNGGSFSDSFKQSLASNAINMAGKKLATEIGNSYRAKDINNLVRYIAHAGTGCLMGSAKGGVDASNQGSSGDNCFAGALGAVTGELAADLYKAKHKESFERLNRLIGDEEAYFDSLIADGMSPAEAKNDMLEDAAYYQPLVADLLDKGVDVARLAGAFSALLAEVDVGIAADTAENAAENNAFFLIPIGVFLLKTLDVSLAAYELYGIQKKLASDDPKVQAQGKKDLALYLAGQGVPLLAGQVIPGLKTSKEFIEWIGKKVQGKEKELDHLRKLDKKKTEECFVAGTLVHTVDGKKPIESIKVGDLVVTKDAYTGHTSFKPVVTLFETPRQTIFELRIAGESGVEEVFGVTGEHPYWVDRKGWVGVKDLSPGDKVNGLDNSWLTVKSVINTQQLSTVYNFEVADYHTYFVGGVGAWVHNNCSKSDPTNVTKGLAVPKNFPKNIHPGQQGKHIPGHNNFTPGRSPLAEGVNPQKLLDGVQSGAHPIVRMTPRGQPVVDFGKSIGQFEGKATQFGIIHHGKKGAHIVPANPVQF